TAVCRSCADVAVGGGGLESMGAMSVDGDRTVHIFEPFQIPRINDSFRSAQFSFSFAIHFAITLRAKLLKGVVEPPLLTLTFTVRSPYTPLFCPGPGALKRLGRALATASAGIFDRNVWLSMNVVGAAASPRRTTEFGAN